MSNKYLDIAMEKVIKQEVNKVIDKIRTEIEQLPITDTAVRLVTAVLDKNKVEKQKCDTCYHNKTEFSICQYCTDGNKYEADKESEE